MDGLCTCIIVTIAPSFHRAYDSTVFVAPLPALPKTRQSRPPSVAVQLCLSCRTASAPSSLCSRDVVRLHSRDFRGETLETTVIRFHLWQALAAASGAGDLDAAMELTAQPVFQMQTPSNAGSSR